jgi:hypothetical protein
MGRPRLNESGVYRQRIWPLDYSHRKKRSAFNRRLIIPDKKIWAQRTGQVVARRCVSQGFRVLKPDKEDRSIFYEFRLRGTFSGTGTGFTMAVQPLLHIRYDQLDRIIPVEALGEPDPDTVPNN